MIGYMNPWIYMYDGDEVVGGGVINKIYSQS